MGFGSYSASDWSRLKTSRRLSGGQTVSEVFHRTTCNPKFDPRYIGTRECFDSEEHPNTTPIVVGLDVTASMGYLAVELATGALNSLITRLYSTGAVEDPALMCAAYGDYRDAFPLQVTQFESDIRIAEQLLEIYFENGGQNMVVPTCLWEFLSRHTNIDCIRKRHQKGYVFTIGDCAGIRSDHVAETISRVTGDDPAQFCPPDILKFYTEAARHAFKNEENVSDFYARQIILSEAQRDFEIVHIMIGTSSDTCNDFLCGRTIRIPRSDISVIPEIIISAIQLFRGNGREAVLSQWDPISQPSIRAAVNQLSITDAAGDISL